jgi:SAM-dependent methyltransferase
VLFKKIHSKLETGQIRALLKAAARVAIRPHIACYLQCRPFFQGKSGLEIGGPSSIFALGGPIPIYPIAARVDNCTFSQQTIWEGSVTEGANFHFDNRRAPGHQYIIEACDLGRIPSSSYDFVISSHVLEHTANPLRALGEWTRVLKSDGLFVLVVPHKDGTFDHRRPVTPFEHLIRDLEAQTTEGDMTHLEEILRLHDLTRDPAAGDLEAFKERSKRNLENRCLHHHVFDTQLADETVRYVGLRILSVERRSPYNIVVVAQKAGPQTQI